jgi:DNA-binding NarL/FixJ family response regulator
LIADDHPIVAESLRAALERDGVEVLDIARDGEEALAKISDRRPAVAVIDLQLPDLRGADVVRRAKEGSPETRTLIFSAHGTRHLIEEALQAGARGYVAKDAPIADVVRAVRTIAAGQTFIDPLLAGELALTNNGAERLSPREREILRLLGDGLRNEEIAKGLYLSTETVRTHLNKAMRKLDARTRTEAVVTALRRGEIF